MKYQTQSQLAPKLTILVGLILLAIMLSLPSQMSIVRAQGPVPNTPYFTSTTMTLPNGQSVDKNTINGPSTPPPGFEAERAAVVLPAAAKTLVVPAFNWVFGCSSVSGAMIAGYYDRNGFANMYTGPTGGGVTPLDNSSWGTWVDSVGDTYPNIPLAGSHNGVDGRTILGSIDDYWVGYGSSASDPYVTGSWTQHAWGTAIGDYMKTSQSAYGNTDGSTTFYNYNTSPTPLTCADMLSGGISTVDGTYGRKLFYEARGYTVTDCYSQKTDNTVAGGFSFAQFKAQIDANRPVMLNLAGHTIVGVGYSDPSTVYIHDTWDYNTHSMTWGGSYSGMQLLSVSIVNLQGSTPPNPVPTPQLPAGTITDTTPTYRWTKVAGATQYRYQLYKGAALVYTKTVTSAVCGASVCVNTPSTVLASAAYKWRVQALVGGAWKSYSVFKPFIVAQPNTKPKAGYWSNGTWNSFHVTPNQVSVKEFSLTVNVGGCGTYRIYRTVLSSIVNKKFSFSGSFYGSGVFDTTLRAHGTTGLNRFYISGCGYVSTNGAVAWSSIWRNSSQSTYTAQLDTAPAIAEPALPGAEDVIVEAVEP